MSWLTLTVPGSFLILPIETHIFVTKLTADGVSVPSLLPAVNMIFPFRHSDILIMRSQAL